MILTAYGEQFECTKAVKGADFIILDGNGPAFYGIRDFSGYSLEGGEWSEPEPDYKTYHDAMTEVLE